MKILSFLPILFVLSFSNAQQYLQANSLLTCMDKSQFWASNLDVRFLPNNNSVSFDIKAISNINDVKVGLNIELIAYGLSVIQKTIELCDFDFTELCPLTSGHLDFKIEHTISENIIKQIPGVAFTVPDLDARVRLVMFNTETNEDLACVEALVNNGKTVQTKYAAWPIAAISGLGLVTSGIVSVIGHSSTAAHISSNSMSLFVYFQSLAITSMLAVARVPPIAAAWSQNFQWSLGVIRVAFVQKISNWYLQATGGEPTSILANLQLSVSVQKVKRSLGFLSNVFGFASKPAVVSHLAKRVSIAVDNDDFLQNDNLNLTLYTTNEKEAADGTRILILRGIQRIAYLARIEITDLFMTSIMFLLFFTFVVVVCMTFFKALVEICIRSNIMNSGKFNEYRQHWLSIIKGALYRLLVVALPQLVVFSLWEFTTHDSPAIVVVAVFLIIVAVGLLGYSAMRVLLMGRRSVRDHKNPAYLLYGDGVFLNKFGFIYVQYRAHCYYFVVVSLTYVISKCLFVAVLQQHGKALSVIVFVIEIVYCVILCWKRPYMDKRTNAFNITIAVINTINALFFMFFSSVFKQPQVVSSVMAVVYFVLNAAFALFLLIFTIVTCVLALVYKNPDARYQPMKDDRVSFLPRLGGKKKNTQGADDIELAALGASAMKGHENAKAARYADSDSIDDDSSHHYKGYQGAYNNGEFTKTSVLDSDEVQQPASTIVGNSTNAYQNFKNMQSDRHGGAYYDSSSGASRRDYL